MNLQSIFCYPPIKNTQARALYVCIIWTIQTLEFTGKFTYYAYSFSYSALISYTSSRSLIEQVYMIGS